MYKCASRLKVKKDMMSHDGNRFKIYSTVILRARLLITLSWCALSRILECKTLSFDNFIKKKKKDLI